jgi:hypothetical protein
MIGFSILSVNMRICSDDIDMKVKQEPQLQGLEDLVVLELGQGYLPPKLAAAVDSMC